MAGSSKKHLAAQGRKPRPRAFYCAFVMLTVSSAPAVTQTQLDPVIVESATLSGDPVDAEKLGSSVTVITGDDLERQQIKHAADALRTVPGLAVNQSGGKGSLSQIRVRGAESNQLAVFIDGVEVNSLDSGEFDFSTLLTTDIERIEVLRGPQSGIYGGNALSGAINIITKKGAGPSRVTISSEAGGFNTRETAASVSAGSEAGYFSASAVARRTDGFNISRNEDEADGSQQKAIFIRGGMQVTDALRVDLIGRHQANEADNDEDFDFDGFLDDARGVFSKREQTFGRANATLELFDGRFTQKLFADYFDDGLKAISAVFSPSENDGQRANYGYQANLSFDTPSFLDGKHGLTGLLQQREESFTTSSAPGKTFERSQTGLVGEYRGEFLNSFFVTANLRHDRNDAFEDALTYQTTAAYLLRESGTRFHASYGKGITNPTFFEQFGVFGGFIGNPRLQPEESIGWDAGVEQSFLDGKAVLDVAYFQSDLENEISFLSLPGFQFTYINADGTSKRQGVEVTLTLRPIDGVILTGNYTYTDSADPDGLREIRRPEHMASLNAAYAFSGGKGQVNLGLSYNGKMDDLLFSFPLQRVALDDYWLANLSASYRIEPNIELFARAENLFDANYEEVVGYQSAGFAAYAGVKIRLGDTKEGALLK